MSSASPPKEPDVEPETQSGDDPEQMDRDNQDPSGQGQEFEVKEQDRWLPIANGSFFFCCLCLFCVFLRLVYAYCAMLISPPCFAHPRYWFSLRAAGCFNHSPAGVVLFRPGLVVDDRAISILYLICSSSHHIIGHLDQFDTSKFPILCQSLGVTVD